MIKVTLRLTWGNWKEIVSKSKGFRISIQKHDKVAEQISFRVPVPIVSHTFIKNMPSCLNRVESIWTLELFIREKS